MKSTGWILGYHGCDASVGEAVLSGSQTLQASSNDYDWLGTGIYFWENDPNRALQWASFAQANPAVCRNKIHEPFVLGAIIDLGNCLDLTEVGSIDRVKLAHEIFMSQPGEKPVNQGSIAAPGRRKLDCAVINFLHDLLGAAGEQPFHSVRALFPEGEELYPGAGFREQTHIQLAIRQEHSIIGYFRPRFDRL